MKKYKTNFPIYGNRYNLMNLMNDMNDMYNMNTMKDMYNMNDISNMKDMYNMNDMYDMNDKYDLDDMYDMYNMNQMNEDYNDNYKSNGIYMRNTMPEMEETDKAFEEDMAYMKEMYPDICKRIQKYIDEECDKLDYEGSYMYDDYPDKEVINIMTDKIYDKVEDQEIIINHIVESSTEVDIQNKRQKWRRYTIKVMLLNEIYRRRRKKCKKYRNKTYNKTYDPAYERYGYYKPHRPNYYYTNPYRYK